MSLILKQSTAVVVSFGPFVDKTDGVTPETGLVSAIDHASTGILLSKNGGALTIRHATVTASTYDAYGNYRVTLDTTDTNTVGSLRMQFIETATCLPVWQDFTIVEEAVFDALFAGSAPGYLQPATPGRTLVVDASGLADANMVKMGPSGSGTAQTARDIGASVLLSSGTGTGQLSFTSGILKVDVDTIKTNPVVNAGTVTFPTGATLASTTNITAGTITTATNLTNAPTAGDFTATMKTSIGTAVAASAVASVTGNVGGNVTGSVGSVAAGGITASSIAADAIGASELAADAVAEIAGAVWDITLSSHLTGGTTGEALNAAGAAGDPWTTTLPGAYSAGSAGYIVGTNVNATISSRLASAGYTAPLDAAGVRTAVGLATANLDTQLDALPTAVENADALLKRDWTSVTGEAGRSVLNALRFLRNKWSIAAGTLTVTKEDDSTSAWTGAVSTTAGDPASGIDPS